MPRIFRSTISMVLILFLAACGSVPKMPFNEDAKKSTKTIAIVEASEPEQYFLRIKQLAGGSALYAFGALGGLILGGIEAGRASNSNTEFNTALAPHNPKIAALWNEELLRAIESKGYAVTKLPALPKTADGRQVDCSMIQGKFDAVLISSITGGYSLISNAEPQVVAEAKLLSDSCQKTIYSESLAYGASQNKTETFIERAVEFSFPSREDLFSNIPKASQALRTGTTELAKRVATEF